MPTNSGSPPRTPSWAVCLISALILSAAIHQLLYFALRNDAHDDDASQHVWWMYRWSDAELFRNDVAAEYFSLPTSCPWGYRSVMWALTRVFDPLHANAVVALILAGSVGALTFQFGKRAGRHWVAGMAAVVFLLGSGQLQLVEGGYARTFGLPLLLAGLIFLFDGRPAALGATLLIASLFYPPIVLSLGATAACVLGVQSVRSRKLPDHSLWLMLFGVATLVILLVTYGLPRPEFQGGTFTLAEAREMPEWNRGGRTQFFLPWKSMYFGSSTGGIGIPIRTAFVLAAALVATVIISRRVVSLLGWSLLFSSMALFAAAHVFFFHLYLPNRYTVYALPAFGIMWIAGAVGLCLEFLSRQQWILRTYRYLSVPALLWSGTVLLSALLISSAGVSAYRRTTRPDFGVKKDLIAAAVFLRDHTPKSSRVVAAPDDADIVTLYGHRSVLASHETTFAYHRKYYLDFAKPRMIDALEAVCATNIGTIDALNERYGITLALVDSDFYRDDVAMNSIPPYIPRQHKIHYVPPFTSRLQHVISVGRERGFALLNPPADRVLFRSGSVTVLRVGPAVDPPIQPVNGGLH